MDRVWVVCRAPLVPAGVPVCAGVCVLSAVAVAGAPRGWEEMWSLLHSGDKGCFHALMFHEENDRQMKIE